MREMKKPTGWIVVVVAAVLLFSSAVTKVRSDGSDHRYKSGDPVPLYANKVGPFHNPSQCFYAPGALFTALVVIYALTSGIAGYTAASFYCQLEGTHWDFDPKLKKFMDDQDEKNKIFMSAVQSVQKVNEGQLQLIKDLSQQIGMMCPPRWSTGGSSSGVKTRSKNRKR